MNLFLDKNNQPSAASEQSSDDIFAAVDRPPNLAETVIRAIEEAIINQQLKPGQRLPTERELGRQFGVSRTVVREAIHALVAKNLIEVSPGSGTIVRSPSTQSISDSITLLLNLGRDRIEASEIVEVRLLLETEIAALSAKRRTDQNIEDLSEAINGMKSAESTDDFVKFDMDFHRRLAESTQNRLYLVLLNSIIDVITNLSLIASYDEEKRKQPIMFHQKILEMVKNADSDGARIAMREHLVAFETTAEQASNTEDT